MATRIPFYKKIYNWIKVNVTATVLSLLLTMLGLSITLYDRKYDPSVEESIQNALKEQKKHELPQIPEAILEEQPRIKQVYATAKMIDRTLILLEGLSFDIKEMENATSIKEVISLGYKERELSECVKIILSNIGETIQEGDQYKVNVEQLKIFVQSTMRKLNEREDQLLNEVVNINNDIECGKTSADRAQKLLIKLFRDYYDSDEVKQYYKQLCDLLVDFKVVIKEKIEVEIVKNQLIIK